MHDIVGVSLSAYRLLPTHPIDGFLGDPKEAVGEKRIFIKGTSQMQVRAQEARSKSARKLALKLLSFIFYERRNGRELMHSTGREKAVESGNY